MVWPLSKFVKNIQVFQDRLYAYFQRYLFVFSYQLQVLPTTFNYTLMLFLLLFLILLTMMFMLMLFPPFFTRYF